MTVLSSAASGCAVPASLPSQISGCSLKAEGLGSEVALFPELVLLNQHGQEHRVSALSWRRALFAFMLWESSF